MMGVVTNDVVITIIEMVTMTNIEGAGVTAIKPVMKTTYPNNAMDLDVLKQHVRNRSIVATSVD